MQIGIHAGLEHWEGTELVELGGLGFVVEGAADQHIKASISALPSSFHQVDARNRAELRADEDAGCFNAAIRIAIGALAGDVAARPTIQRFKTDAVFLMGLLYTRHSKRIKNHLSKVCCSLGSGSLFMGIHQ